MKGFCRAEPPEFDEISGGINPMSRPSPKRSFGQVIRERRRQLNLTQDEVARRIKTSAPYVGHLEAEIGILPRNW